MKSMSVAEVNQTFVIKSDKRFNESNVGTLPTDTGREIEKSMPGVRVNSAAQKPEQPTLGATVMDPGNWASRG